MGGTASMALLEGVPEYFLAMLSHFLKICRQLRLKVTYITPCKSKTSFLDILFGLNK